MKKFLIGLLSLALIRSQNCGAEEISFGDLCLSQQEAQDCYNHMGLLSAAPENNPSISNTCTPEVVAQRQRYNFEISYQNGYFHNPDCNTQVVRFQESTLQKGEGDLDQWEFDSQSQTVNFSIEHDSLDSYNCIKLTNEDEYIWQCMMALDILMGGVEQLTYSFHITIYLSRIYENELTVTVDKNTVEGDCCENELGIITSLHFCDDFSCENWLSNGQVIQRKDDVYVEHHIDSTEFDYYYLKGLQIKLGSFVPEIIDTNGSLPGRLMYHFQSNIAMDNMVLEVVSQIQENPSTRRVMQEQQIENEDEYRLKAVNSISVEDFSIKEKELEKEKDMNLILIGATVGMGVVVISSIMGVIFYFKRQKARRMKKYEQKEQKAQQLQESQQNTSELIL